MNLTPEELKRIGEAIGPIAASLGAWWTAHKAKKYAKPTGNGFAQKVTDSLERIETKVDKQGKKVKKIDKRLTAVENREPNASKDEL